MLFCCHAGSPSAFSYSSFSLFSAEAQCQANDGLWKERMLLRRAGQAVCHTPRSFLCVGWELLTSTQLYVILLKEWGRDKCREICRGWRGQRSGRRDMDKWKVVQSLVVFMFFLLSHAVSHSSVLNTDRTSTWQWTRKHTAQWIHTVQRPAYTPEWIQTQAVKVTWLCSNH